MANRHANLGAESVQKDLASHKEEDAESNVSQWPAVVQCSSDKQNLHHNVDEELDRIQKVEHDEESNSIGRTQPGPALERRKRNQKTDGKRNERANTHHPHRKRRAILIQLESHKTIDEQARYQRTAQAILDADEVRIRVTPRRRDTSVHNQRDEGQQHVQVEEAEDLLAADGGELAADVQDHDDRHDEGDNVHGRRGALEDDGVGQLDIAGIAVGLDAYAV